jgi:hypothetical protein
MSFVKILFIMEMGQKMNQLNITKTTKIMASLVESNSLRAAARVCAMSFNTVLKLVPEMAVLAWIIKTRHSAISFASEQSAMKYGRSAMPRIRMWTLFMAPASHQRFF